MLNFIYNTPTTVYFGKDGQKQVGKIINELGYKKIMLQYGKGSIKSNGLYQQVINSLNEYSIEVVECGGVEPNPKIEFVRDAIKLAKQQKVEFILAVGGGSVIDSSKFTALGVVCDIDVWDFAMGKSVPQGALPVGCILTISAAGSEMSASAVVSNLSISKKKGCTTEFNRCKFAIWNPELTYSVSPYQTACGVVDIMAHTIERYFTDLPETPLTDSIAESILKNVISAGKIALERPTDYNARATLMWASSLSHNGLTSCGREGYLAVHQLEHAVSGEFDHVAHGAGLAVLFPAWAKFIYKHNVDRFYQFAVNVWGVTESDKEKGARLGIQKMEKFFASLGLETKLSDFGIKEQDLIKLALLCTNNNTTTVKNYIPLGYNEILEIFKLAL